MLDSEERNVAEVKDGSKRLGFHHSSGKVKWTGEIWENIRNSEKNDISLLSCKYLSFFKFHSQTTVLFQHFVMLN